jgi:hypothetical protein
MQMINQSSEVYDLHIRWHHNYIVTKHNVRVHNFFPAVLAAGAWIVANYEIIVGITLLPWLIPFIFKKTNE